MASASNITMLMITFVSSTVQKNPLYQLIRLLFDGLIYCLWFIEVFRRNGVMVTYAFAHGLSKWIFENDLVT